MLCMRLLLLEMMDWKVHASPSTTKAKFRRSCLTLQQRNGNVGSGFE